MASGGSEEKVGEFTINFSDILGFGSFGTVTTGTDANGKTVAAKRIPLEDEKRARKVSNELDRLKTLDHQNIVNIFEVDRQQMVLWIIMEYCQYGDLNHFFRKRTLNGRQKLKIMHQIVMGVEYLHSKDIIHRDIKPANILVAQEKPVVVKLTDFDCSKFLDPHFVTSCMSTNVGTPAFKAPEFFQRVKVGDKTCIKYHRNIDIYAAGLTFLAMIQGNEHLAPRIETANVDSELFQPIGQLIAERIKYKSNTLEILSSGKEKHPSAEVEGIEHLRELIREMTRPEPTDRISAAEVVQRIEQILQQKSTAEPILQRIQKILKKIPIEVRANVVMTAGTGLYWCRRTRFTVLQTGHEVIWGKSSRESPAALHIFIKSPDGLQKVREVKGFCEHVYVYLTPFRGEFVAVVCGFCEKIRLYNIMTTEVTTALHNERLEWITGATAEEGIMYISNLRGVLKLNVEQIPFTVVQTIDVEFTSSWWDMIHIPAPYNLLVFNQFHSGSTEVLAVSCLSGEKRWEYSRKERLEYSRDGIYSRSGATCYSREHEVLFVGEMNEILVLDPEDGARIQVIEMGEEFRFIPDLYIRDETLIVHHSSISSEEPKVSFVALE